MVKDIITIIFNSIETEKTYDSNGNILFFTINTPPIIINKSGILRVSNFCHVGTGTNHTDTIYIFRVRGINIDTSKYITAKGGYPIILTTTFNNNRSLYDENIITLNRQTINSIDLLVDSFSSLTSTTGTFNSVSIINGGSNYLVGQVLKLTGGGSTDVSIKVSSVNSGSITGLTLIDTPTNTYTSSPTLTTFITGSDASATAVLVSQTISSINFSNYGVGYKQGQQIIATGGGGSNFSATISAVSATGVITLITYNNAGSGYTSAPTISILPTTQAQTAILSPEMIFPNIFSNSFPKTLNYCITFTIEQDEF